MPARCAMADLKPQKYLDARPADELAKYHERARTTGSDWVYDFVRMVVTPPSIGIYRAIALGTENVPSQGAVILAPNHFSNVDHFFSAMYIRRDVRFMAKSQLYKNPVLGAIISHGGSFPVRRGQGDRETFKTAYSILDQGGCLLIYAEGGRSRTGKLGKPRRGVGLIALESGVPVIPVAIHGSGGVRGWRRGHFPKVTIQYGEPLSFDMVKRPDREQQQHAAERIFGRVREMYDAIERDGRRSVWRSLRAARAAQAEKPTPATSQL